jgi:hypothetical protein
MPSETETILPSVLWKSMTEDRRLEAARAFWEDQQSMTEQAEVVGAIARQINFRTKTVMTMPLEKKVRHLVRLSRVSEPVAARLLVAYHLASQRPMMGAFLDALGIAHESGLISDDNVKVPEAERVREAARSIAGAYPADAVQLYFKTLLVQDPEAWSALRGALGATATT